MVPVPHDVTLRSEAPHREEVGRRPSPVARLVLAVVWLYRQTALLRTPRCRFHPTCSSYAAESIRVHGAVRGSAHAVARIARCHPWNPGGIDPVRPPKTRK